MKDFDIIRGSVSDVCIYIHARRGDRQGQETFLAPSADKQTCIT